MKILKSGEIPKDQYIVKCYICRSDFQVHISEIHFDKRNDNKTFIWLRCPFCNEIIADFEFKEIKEKKSIWNILAFWKQ